MGHWLQRPCRSEAGQPHYLPTIIISLSISPRTSKARTGRQLVPTGAASANPLHVTGSSAPYMSDLRAIADLYADARVWREIRCRMYAEVDDSLEALRDKAVADGATTQRERIEHKQRINDQAYFVLAWGQRPDPTAERPAGVGGRHRGRMPQHDPARSDARRLARPSCLDPVQPGRSEVVRPAGRLPGAEAHDRGHWTCAPPTWSRSTCCRSSSCSATAPPPQWTRASNAPSCSPSTASPPASRGVAGPRTGVALPYRATSHRVRWPRSAAVRGCNTG